VSHFTSNILLFVEPEQLEHVLFSLDYRIANGNWSIILWALNIPN